jgi:hypothetical protein
MLILSYGVYKVEYSSVNRCEYLFTLLGDLGFLVGVSCAHSPQLSRTFGPGANALGPHDGEFFDVLTYMSSHNNALSVTIVLKLCSSSQPRPGHLHTLSTPRLQPQPQRSSSAYKIACRIKQLLRAPLNSTF